MTFDNYSMSAITHPSHRSDYIKLATHFSINNLTQFPHQIENRDGEVAFNLLRPKAINSRRFERWQNLLERKKPKRTKDPSRSTQQDQFATNWGVTLEK